MLPVLIDIYIVRWTAVLPVLIDIYIVHWTAVLPVLIDIYIVPLDSSATCTDRYLYCAIGQQCYLY